jgi:uncharacterized membrane protein (UPF0127 family)
VVGPSLMAVNATRDTVLAQRLEWAGTSDTRRRGLLGRTEFPAGEGLYLVPCKWIHMYGMKFAIDVAFLGSDGRILAVHEGLRPNRLSRPVFRAEGVLELPESTLRRTGTRVGDTVRFTEADVDGAVSCSDLSDPAKPENGIRQECRSSTDRPVQRVNRCSAPLRPSSDARSQRRQLSTARRSTVRVLFELCRPRTACGNVAHSKRARVDDLQLSHKKNPFPSRMQLPCAIRVTRKALEVS